MCATASSQRASFSTDFCALFVDIVIRPSKLYVVVTFVTKSPIITTLDTLIADLKESMQILREKEKHITGLAAAIRSLAGVCEDEEIKASYLLALEEVSGKPGFVDAVRAALKESTRPLTATQIKESILMSKKMDLSGYSNPMASIHTTLRRMKEKGDVQESVSNTTDEKLYRLVVKAPIPPSMRKALGRN